MVTTLQLPPPHLERIAVQLSADVYLPLAELQAKYPGAIIRARGCDRVMILRVGPCCDAAPLSSQQGSSPSPEVRAATQHGPTLFVAFMGTHDRASLISDLNLRRARAVIGHEPLSGELHEGFMLGVNLLWEDILAAIMQIGSDALNLVVTGHSRGGSEAEIFAGAYASTFAIGYKTFPQIEYVLPLAPARPGDATFRDWYNARLGHRTFFFHHGADIVPWLPGWLIGNRGVGHRVWFPDGPVGPCCAAAPLSGHQGQSQGRDIARPYRIVDPALPRLAANLGGLLWDQNLFGLTELLADHHVSTYVKLLTA